MPARPSLEHRLREFFAVDDDWSRPVPEVGRTDVLTGVALVMIGTVTTELSRSAGGLGETSTDWWVPHLVVAAGAVALIWRRRYPLTLAVYLVCHMFLTGMTLPAVTGQLSLQICYFAGLFSAMSWSRSRRTAAMVCGGILAFMLSWLGWQFALGSALQDLVDNSDGEDPGGFFPAVPSVVALTFVVNLLYFCGAIVGGQVAWRGTRQRARLTHQARTIEAQAASLRRRAVVDERLRIARELHDVVGHHVSVIGVQAAGAGRVLERDPAAAAEALGTIETSSREAVIQMRSLLGTLRDIETDAGPDPDGTGPAGSDRAPEPALIDVGRLVEARSTPLLETSYSLIEDVPEAASRVPGPVGLSLYRTVQEALANVSRHSTAARATVTVRIVEEGNAPFAEAEVLDDGRPRRGTSGSGLGQLGIRERVSFHGGQCEIGPRATSGYRVRVRLPLATAPAGTGEEPRG